MKIRLTSLGPAAIAFCALIVSGIAANALSYSEVRLLPSLLAAAIQQLQ
jgi:hypothetical protein